MTPILLTQFVASPFGLIQHNEMTLLHICICGLSDFVFLLIIFFSVSIFIS